MAVVLRGYGGAAAQQRRVNRVDAGWVRLSCVNPPLNEVIRLGPEPPKISGGFGGWETTQRPKAVGMTTWSGVPPFELEVNLMLDGNWTYSQEQLIQDLIDVARGTERATPGIVGIDGIPALPADQWVITNLDFGDLLRRQDMHRIRQQVTIQFLEYQAPDYETLRKGATAKARPKTVGYKVKKGDTPAKIARARRCKWMDIRAVNPKGVIKTANQKLKAGIQIRVPIKQVNKATRRHHKK
jgi:hypothetical protein